MSVKSARPYVPFGRIVLGGIVTIVVAVVANLIVRWLLMAVLPISPEFPPFGVSAIAMFTTIGVILATLVYWVITKMSYTPVRTFRIVAVIALVISILPNILAAINPAAMPMQFPGATGPAFGALIVLHIVAAVICMTVLPAVAKPEVPAAGFRIPTR